MQFQKQAKPILISISISVLATLFAIATGDSIKGKLIVAIIIAFFISPYIAINLYSLIKSERHLGWKRLYAVLGILGGITGLIIAVSLNESNIKGLLINVLCIPVGAMLFTMPAISALWIFRGFKEAPLNAGEDLLTPIKSEHIEMQYAPANPKSTSACPQEIEGNTAPRERLSETESSIFWLLKALYFLFKSSYTVLSFFTVVYFLSNVIFSVNNTPRLEALGLVMLCLLHLGVLHVLLSMISEKLNQLYEKKYGGAVDVELYKFFSWKILMVFIAIILVAVLIPQLNT